MRPLILVFCVWSSLSPVLGATPAEDFAARGKELFANKENLGEADRLHRLFDFSWECSKIGQLKIRQLRTDAEKDLGANFDLRAFHDEVLKNGALPMSVLETHIQGWVAKRKGA